MFYLTILLLFFFLAIYIGFKKCFNFDKHAYNLIAGSKYFLGGAVY